MLAYYYGLVNPPLVFFLVVSIFHRILAHVTWRFSGNFHQARRVLIIPKDAPPPPPQEEDEDKDNNADENADAPADAGVVPPPEVEMKAKSEAEAVAWMLTYARSENASVVARKTYRFYELWVPLAMRMENDDGVPKWFSIMTIITMTPVIMLVVAITVSLSIGFSYQINQEPILGLITCDKQIIDAALHCDAYTESCHLTPPCGSHAVDYAQLVETYHDRCTGSTYPKIAMIKNVCFMEKDGLNNNNSWKHVWMKLVGSDFHGLESTLISFYRNARSSGGKLREIRDEPVRVFYDQIGSLVGYGVNTITPSGIVKTNINHDDLMSTLTIWRNKKLTERRRQKPCICAPHLGILNRMIFMWEDDINMWKIYMDHNVSSSNTVLYNGNLIPKYDDFPRNVDAEIATSIRGETRGEHHVRSYPGASIIDLLEVNMNTAAVRPVDLQTTQQISRHWSLEGPVLQSQIPHVYFDASLELYRQATSGSLSGMSQTDGTIVTQRITDPIAACYYQCSRIFDEVDSK